MNFVLGKFCRFLGGIPQGDLSKLHNRMTDVSKVSFKMGLSMSDTVDSANIVKRNCKNLYICICT